jgi:photosynthetic reaction center cytochrome c subunit
MNMRSIQIASTLLLVVLLLAGCERFPMDSVQHGYRGTGMVQVYNPRILETKDALNTAPAALPAASPDGPKAKDLYKNVQVLGDLSGGEFVRLMTAMTNWVSPQEGCVYCHNPANFAEDTKYTKVVARKMIQMTRSTPGALVNLSSLPTDPLTPYLLEDKPIRVNGTAALPSGNRQSIKQAEWTYGLMTHMSTSLGVNCTYCHNTRSFSSWENSPPQRVTAYYGIRMARDLNNNYMTPLTEIFPDNRKGASGDVAKVSCATCHQGAFKPLYGYSMVKDHPELAATP